MDIDPAFNSGNSTTFEEPKVGDYFPSIVSTFYHVPISILAYLLFVNVYGPRMMCSRKAYNLKGVLLVYNLIQVLCNGYLLLWTWNIGGFSLQSLAYPCHPITGVVGPDPFYHTAFMKIVFCSYLTKLLDLLDTVFFVLRKKQSQITFLHQFHHISMVYSVWITTVYFREEMFAYFGMINMSVHVLMYSYYFLSALGPSVQKYLWWKKHLTKIQLIQFTILLSLLGRNTYNNCKILSRIKPAFGSTQQDTHVKTIPTLEQFLTNRDYTGAITLLEFEQSTGKGTQLTELWLGYCAFHLGDYKRAMNIYTNLARETERPEDATINLVCCYFFLGLYEEAQKALEETPQSNLKRRLQFHLAHKLGHEAQLMELHQQLENITEDMLCLAALHYLRSSYHEAIDIYKKILLDNRIPFITHECTDLEFVEILAQTTQYIALNVYVALCYYKLDYYDMSQEVLATYLQKFPDSATALNLKACNYFKLENVKAAENEIMTLLERSSPSFIFGQDIIKHNLVAFRDGNGALQVLPSLVDIIPEARLNLTIYYLKQGEYMEAYELIKNLEPAVSYEYILKATVNAVIGQETNSRELMKGAQQYFQLVGNSVSECDTIPGRQCMASAFFFQRKFDDVHLYLSSIKSYFFKDDAFNFNYAQAKSALGNYKEAEETFLRIQNEKLQNDYVYITHMARCCIMQGKAQTAWELYLKMDTSTESLSLLQLIANDCYKKGEFYHAAKAFDLLERLDPTPEHWEGKRGACIGVFQLIVADRQPTNLLSEIIQLLRNSTNPQVESIIRIIKRWAKERKINI